MSLASLLKKGGLRQLATAIPATFATAAAPALSKVARVATVAVANPLRRSANDHATVPGKAVPIEDPDRWCWPTSTAMTGAEIDTYMARLSRFTDRGVTQADAETLADTLVIRDREGDDRWLCLECAHLVGHSKGWWRCANWQESQLSHMATDAALPRDLVSLLQRCDGFDEHNQTRTIK